MQETVVKQSQEGSSSLPVLYKRDDLSIQSNPIEGAIQLWATLNEKDTVVIYQQAAAKTWELFKQAIAFIFFLFLLLIALIIWVCGIAFQSGLNFRNWLEVKQPTLDEIVSAFFKVVVWSLVHPYEWAASFIKKYLGWEIKFDPLTPKSPATKPEQTTASDEKTAGNH